MIHYDDDRYLLINADTSVAPRAVYPTFRSACRAAQTLTQETGETYFIVHVEAASAYTCVVIDAYNQVVDTEIE